MAAIIGVCARPAALPLQLDEESQSDGDQTEAAIATLDDARLRFMPTRRVTPRDSVRCDASFSPGQKVALADDSPN